MVDLAHGLIKTRHQSLGPTRKQHLTPVRQKDGGSCQKNRRVNRQKQAESLIAMDLVQRPYQLYNISNKKKK
jgi:hypothetical protein